LFLKSAKQGIPNAYNNLGLIEEGDGLKLENIPIAAQYYAVAANAGSDLARQNLERLAIRFPNIVKLTIK